MFALPGGRRAPVDLVVASVSSTIGTSRPLVGGFLIDRARRTGGRADLWEKSLYLVVQLRESPFITQVCISVVPSLPFPLFKWQIQTNATSHTGAQAGWPSASVFRGEFKRSFLAETQATQQPAFISSSSLMSVWCVWVLKLNRHVANRYRNSLPGKARSVTISKNKWVTIWSSSENKLHELSLFLACQFYVFSDRKSVV